MNKLTYTIIISAFIILSHSASYASTRYMIITRHGEGEHNVNHFYSSNPDHPKYRVANLTELGKKQVEYTAKKLKAQSSPNQNIAQVFVSPLPRTIQTAKIMAGIGLFETSKMTIEPRIIEIQAGSLEGEHYDPKTLNWSNPHEGATDDESNKELRCRMQNFYNDVIKAYPEGNIVLVTHGSPSMQLIEMLTDQKIELHTADSIMIPISTKTLEKEVCNSTV